MTNPPSLSLNDYMLAYFKAGAPLTGNHDAGSVTEGVGIKTQGAGGGSNVTIVNPVDGSGNVKVAVQGTVPVSGTVTTTPSGTQTVTGSVAITGSVSTPQLANKYVSVSNTGSATAPGAAAVLATLTIGTTGYYQVDCVVGFGGTAETAALDNFQLNLAGAAQARPPVANAVNWQSGTFTVFLSITAAQVLNITAIAAGSAGSIYKATVTATKLN